MGKASPEHTRKSDQDVERIERRLEKRDITFEALFGLFEKIGTTLELETVVRLFLLTLMGQLRVRRIALYLDTTGKRRFAAYHSLGIGRRLLPRAFRPRHPFLRLLRESEGVPHIDSFFTAGGGGVSEETAEFLGEMGRRGFAYAFPLVDRDELLGVVFLSGKVTGEGFSQFDDELLRMLATIATITIRNAVLYREAVRSTRELERFSRIKKEFINHTSHELRTPITVLKSALWSIETEEMEEGILIDMSKDAVLRMQGKIEQLLSLNDIELNGTAFDLAPTDVSSLVEECLREIIPELEEKQVTVDFDDRTRYREIVVDAAKMKLVLRGVIDNAVNAVERGGVISVSTEVTEEPPGADAGIEIPGWSGDDAGRFPSGSCDDRCADTAGSSGDDADFQPSSSGSFFVIRVRDDGIGIPEGEITRIAEPFHRASNSPLTNVKGLGIGLSVASKVIAGHGGRFFCRSREGGGSEFSIWLMAD